MGERRRAPRSRLKSGERCLGVREVGVHLLRALAEVASACDGEGGWARVQIAWDSEELREICEVSSAADAALGQAVAAQLRARLADLAAADSPLDLLAGGPELIDGDSPSVRIRLASHVLLVIVSNHRPSHGNANATDWSRVRRIRIVSIGGTSNDG